MGAGDGTRPLRIIVLDDDVDVADGICDVLGVNRHVARAVYDLPAAWGALGAAAVDVLVADYHIGVADSGVLLASVRLRLPRVGRVLISASPPGDWRHLVERGVVHAALKKPFVAFELVELVEAVSRSRAQG